MEENEDAIAKALAEDLDRNAAEAFIADVATHRRRSEVRGQEGAQVDASQVPAARDATAARSRLGRVRALRHRADHRRLELPVLPDAGPGGRGDRRRKRRHPQAFRNRRGVVATDGRAGTPLSRQRRDRGRRGRRHGESGTHRAGPGPRHVHRRHRDRPQGLRGRGAASDPRHTRTRRQESGDRGGRRRRGCRGQADRLDQDHERRPDLRRARLRAGRRDDPRRARRQDRRRPHQVPVQRRPERDAHRQSAPVRPAQWLHLGGASRRHEQGGRRAASATRRVCASSRPWSSTPTRTGR